MGRIRPFEPADISQLVELGPRAYPEGTPYPPAAYFEEFFFRTPCQDESIRPLVAESDQGRIVAFIGVMPRRFVLNGRPVTVAVANRFIVAPEARSTTAGLSLFNRFLSGPQDLTFADSTNAPGRIIWQAFRAQIVWPYGVNWRCRLRPAPGRRLRGALSRRKGLSLAGTLAGPALGLLDKAAAAAWRRRHPLKVPEASCLDIDAGTIVESMGDVAGHRALRPCYDRETLDWLVRRAAAKTVHGDLRARGVRDAKGRLLGWFLYYLNTRGNSLLIQFMARPDASETVLDCLLYDAAEADSPAVVGRLEPRLLTPLSARSDISFKLSEYWTLAHTRNPEILAAVHSGDAVLSKLDGEWSMTFLGEALDDMDARPDANPAQTVIHSAA